MLFPHFVCRKQTESTESEWARLSFFKRSNIQIKPYDYEQ